MNNKYKIILGVIIVIAAVFLFTNKAEVKLGSIQEGQAYYSTTTGTFAVATSSYIRIGPGMFGSVIVASTTNVAFRVMDATSTLDIASTTLAKFPAGVAAGTYTFDSVFTRGLFLELQTGFAGADTVTYK